MRLRIRYSRLSDETSAPVYSVSATLRETAGSAVQVPQYLLEMKLETLARRWWLTQNRQPDEDANAALCSEDSAWSAAKVSDLVQNMYTVRSSDAVIVAATVERLKRASVMIFHCFLYQMFLEDASERDADVVHLSLNPDKPQPGGKALPPLPQAIIDRIDTQ